MRLPFLKQADDPLLRHVHDSIRDRSMPRKHVVDAAEMRARNHRAVRLRRFAKQFERWCRGEQVRSYDTKWLAYLKEHQLEPRHRRWKVG